MVGSNIFNILLIVGIASVILPLAVNESLIRQEVPVMVGLSLLLLMLVFDRVLSRFDAAILFSLGIFYLIVLWVQTNRALRNGQNTDGNLAGKKGWLARAPAPFLLIIGLIGLFAGAQFLVTGATSIAISFGISELIVGLTVVAIGTSLPEVATSVAAALRGERDMAIGNVVGSNIFNIVFCLGIAGLVAPAGLDAPTQLLEFDIRVMVVVGIIFLLLIVTDRIVKRLEGLLLLVWSTIYLAWTILFATNTAMLLWFSNVVLFGFVPVTVLFITVTVAKSVGNQRRQRE